VYEHHRGKRDAVRRTQAWVARLSHNVDVILSAMELLPFEAPADEFYARIRDELERAEHPSDPNDMLIAAQALSII